MANFTSDQGDYLGDHGLMLELLLHYQGLVRVPFIWHDPARPGGDLVEDDSQRTVTGFDRPQRVRTVITEWHRMSLREGENRDELYNLEADPGELLNRYDRPNAAEVRSALSETMQRRMIELQDRAPSPAYRA